MYSSRKEEDQQMCVGLFGKKRAEKGVYDVDKRGKQKLVVCTVPPTVQRHGLKTGIIRCCERRWQLCTN